MDEEAYKALLQSLKRCEMNFHHTLENLVNLQNKTLHFGQKDFRILLQKG